MFQPFLPQDGIGHGCVHFVIDQRMDGVCFGEAVDRVGFMLPNAPHKIAGHADIERALAFAGQDIDARSDYPSGSSLNFLGTSTVFWAAATGST